MLPIAFVAVLIVRMMRPLVLIRFGLVRSDAMGHSAFDPEWYLSEREIENGQSLDYFYFQRVKSPNEQWETMVRRNLRIRSFARYLDTVNRALPGGKPHHKSPSDCKSRDLKGYFARTDPHILFVDEENLMGLEYLKKIGMQREEKFVCLLVRDSAYKDKWQNWKGRTWSYHDYRDSDIDNYEEAALALAHKGYWVLRMGKTVKKPFRARHPRIVDYATTPHRSDFLDVWLMANCHFTISTGTGLDSVSDAFRRPVVYANFDLLTHVVSWNPAVTVPKKLIWIETGKRLTLKEQLAHSYMRSQDYKKMNIEVRDRTPDEITAAVLEMESRISGTWNDIEEDVQLQKKIFEIIVLMTKRRNLHGIIHPQARFGKAFLDADPEWVD